MPNVLVVEDNDDVREMMSVALQLGGGHAVRTAANGAQALALLNAGYRPAVILADLMMPVMNGWELRERLMGDPELAGIPVLVVSAVTGAAQTVQGAQCLTKPVDIERLLVLVDQYCRGSGSAINGPVPSPLR